MEDTTSSVRLEGVTQGTHTAHHKLCTSLFLDTGPPVTVSILYPAPRTSRLAGTGTPVKRSWPVGGHKVNRTPWLKLTYLPTAPTPPASE